MHAAMFTGSQLLPPSHFEGHSESGSDEGVAHQDEPSSWRRRAEAAETHLAQLQAYIGRPVEGSTSRRCEEVRPTVFARASLCTPCTGPDVLHPCCASPHPVPTRPARQDATEQRERLERQLTLKTARLTALEQIVALQESAIATGSTLGDGSMAQAGTGGAAADPASAGAAAKLLGAWRQQLFRALVQLEAAQQDREALQRSHAREVCSPEQTQLGGLLSLSTCCRCTRFPCQGLTRHPRRDSWTRLRTEKRRNRCRFPSCLNDWRSARPRSCYKRRRQRQ